MDPRYTEAHLPAGGALPGSTACSGSAHSTHHSQLVKNTKKKNLWINPLVEKILGFGL